MIAVQELITCKLDDNSIGILVLGIFSRVYVADVTGTCLKFFRDVAPDILLSWVAANITN